LGFEPKVSELKKSGAIGYDAAREAVEKELHEWKSELWKPHSRNVMDLVILAVD